MPAEPATAADFNPYAPSQVTELASTARLIGPDSSGIWRDGRRVVIPHGAALPLRCWNCNAPADLIYSRRVYWLHPAWLLLVLLNVFILLVVALFVRKRADFALGLCHEHALMRRRRLTVAWLLTIGGFALTAASAVAYQDSAILLLAGLALFFSGLCYGAFFATMCSAKRIDHYAAWVTGAGGNFLDDLPTYPVTGPTA